MTKNRAIRRFILIAFLVAIGIVLTVGGFRIPFTTQNYNGFAGSTQKGLELGGGVSVVYQSEDADEDTLRADASKIKGILSSQGYEDFTVELKDENKIELKVAKTNDTDEFFDALANPRARVLYITIGDKPEKSSPDGNYVYGRTDVSKISLYVSYENQTLDVGLTVTFNEVGREKYKALISQSAENSTAINYYLDDELIMSQTATDSTGSNSVILRGSAITSSTAYDYLYTAQGGTLTSVIKLVEKKDIKATLGDNINLWLWIAGAIIAVAVMVLMWVRYGDFGLLANFASVIFVILYLFFLMALPIFNLTLGGVLGILLASLILVDGYVVIFEKIKDEYALGKKMHLAVKGGFKRAFWTIFDSNVAMLLISIILYFIGGYTVKSFALALAVGTLLSAFTTLVITRFFLKSYLPINSTKPQKARLFRDKAVEVETEDEQK